MSYHSPTKNLLTAKQRENLLTSDSPHSKKSLLEYTYYELYLYLNEGSKGKTLEVEDITEEDSDKP